MPSHALLKSFRLRLFWRKSISRNDFTLYCVFGCAWKIKFFGKTFHLIVCFEALIWKLVYTFIFTSNHFQTHQTRKERERERERKKKETSSFNHTDPPTQNQAPASCTPALARSRHEPAPRSTHLVHW